MSLQMIRKSVLVMVVAAGLLAGGIWAGRLVAGPAAAHGGFSAAAIFGHLADRLDLSDSQRSQIKEILRTHESVIVSQFRAQSAARQALGAAITADPFDEGAVRQKAQVLGRIHADGAVLLAQIRSEIWPVLNDEQKSKVEGFRQRMSKKGDRLVASIQEFLGSAN